MKPISEAELKILAMKSPSPIYRFEIMETEDGLGWWYLKVFVGPKAGKSKDKEPFILTSARKSARRWGDLNNTVGWIRKLNLPDAEILVIPNWPEESA